MRSRARALVGTILLLAMSGCAMRPASRVDSPVTALAGAATPAEAVERLLRAQNANDEDAFRAAVIFRPPAHYCESESRWYFAGRRLYDAVHQRHMLAFQNGLPSTQGTERLHIPWQFEYAEEIGPRLATMPTTRMVAPPLEFVIVGNVATPSDPNRIASESATTTVERFADGWRVVRSDRPRMAEPAAIRAFTESHNIFATIYDDAASRARDGRLADVHAVNEFIDHEQKRIADSATAALLAAEPTGPVVVVTDRDDDAPLAGVSVWAPFLVAGTFRPTLEFKTDAVGRVRLPAEPDSLWDIHVAAPGYARDQHSDRQFVWDAGGVATEVHIAVGRPIVVETTLVLPDERRAVLSIQEGEPDGPPPRGLRERVGQVTRVVHVDWGDVALPTMPNHNPLISLDLTELPTTQPATQPTSQPALGRIGVVYRVAHAHTAAGRELAVFRDRPPTVDMQDVALFEIGHDGFGSAVFVIGTLADARAAAESASTHGFRWEPNSKVIDAMEASPAPRPR